ncbi:MAG: recombinase family protein, partial [bacterium]|nr:recombinase family protein [bacterium]
MKRMAAYCRVSTEKEEQLSSLENQKEFFEQYAKKTGDKLVRLYADEGISGKSMKKRDAFMQMLADAEKGEFDYVAVKDISRFARNTSDFLYGIRTLRSYGVDVRFLSSNQTVIGESEFVLTIFAALAQEESANLSKRVIFGKRQNAKKGRVPNIVYGYDKIDTYTLAVNPEESAVVKIIFKWYIEGDGSRRIAIKLNEMGIPTKKNTKWIPQTIRRILQNPVYAGQLVNNKSETKDFLNGTRKALPQEEWYVHERPELQLVSREDFELVQKKIIERQEQYKNDNPGHRYSNRHIFSNLIKCSECGKGFTAKVYRWKNSYVRYRCAAHNNGNAQCKNSVTIDEQELLEEVKKYLISIIEDKKTFAK